MVTYYQVTAELYQEHVVPVLNAKQFDTGRGVDITLTDCGAVVVPSAGEQLRLYCKKPDGTVSYISGSLSGNAVRVRFTNQLLAVEGIVECELQVGTGSTMVSTPVFNVLVLPSNYDEAAIISSDEFTALDTALRTVQSYDQRIINVEDRAVARGRLQSNTSIDVALEAFQAYLVVGYGYGSESVSTVHYIVAVAYTNDRVTGVVPIIASGTSHQMTVTAGDGLSITLAAPTTYYQRYTVFRLG